MDKVAWETIDIKQYRSKRGEKFASIGGGRISLSAAACSLIDNIYDYEWIEVKQGKKSNKVVQIGLFFTNNEEDNYLRPTRIRSNGKEVKGIYINSRPLVRKYFGETKEISASRYTVEKVGENAIAINILEEL